MGIRGNAMLMSIIMPTYNSEDTIKDVLDSIEMQNFDKEQLEVLVVDGGSMDNTLKIVSMYSFVRILYNERKLPEIAKHIGFLNAKGEYAMYLDSDEIIQSRNSIQNRIKIMKYNHSIKNVVSSGMISREDAKGIVQYANYVADPFSKFVYRYNGCNRLEDISKQYKTEDIGNAKVIDFRKANRIPLFDAAGNMFEMKFAKEIYSSIENKDEFIANIFEYMVSATKQAIIMKDDFIIHIPRLTIKKYLRKLKWRVKNNIFVDRNEGVGFANRQKNSKYLAYRKFAFVPYCILILPVLFDAVYFSIINKKFFFLIHFCFSWYVLLNIVHYLIIKVLHFKYKKIETYG